jgi:hypothetical protein
MASATSVRGKRSTETTNPEKKSPAGYTTSVGGKRGIDLLHDPVLNKATAVNGRSYWSQCRELMLLAITYNIMLLHAIRVFLQSKINSFLSVFICVHLWLLRFVVRPLQQLRLAEFAQINLSAHLALDEPQPRFHFAQLHEQRIETRLRIVARPGPRHLRVIELPLQRREEK